VEAFNKYSSGVVDNIHKYTKENGVNDKMWTIWLIWLRHSGVHSWAWKLQKLRVGK
jgi:hypothetical protein